MQRALLAGLAFTLTPIAACITGGGSSTGAGSAISAKTTTHGALHLVDDFEGGSAKTGAAWGASADQNNLGSIAQFERKAGEGKSGQAGYFTGHVGKNVAPWPWASLAVGIRPDQSPTDITAVKAIRFWVKGDGKTYKLALPRQAVTDYANFGATFVAPTSWTQIEIPVEKFTQPNWGKQLSRVFDDVRVIEFQPTVPEADFAIFIDDLEVVLDPSKASPFAPKEEPVVHVDGKEVLLDDFDAQGPRNGAVWGAEMDMNNLGTIAVQRTEPTGDDERKLAAHFKGKLGKNIAPWPWATLAVNLNANAEPVNFSAVKAVRFWVKGNGEQVRFTVTRKVVTDYGHFGYAFSVPTTWKQLTIPIERLAQADWAKKVEPGFADAVSLQWSPVTGDASFDVWIDHVELILDPAKPAPFKTK